MVFGWIRKLKSGRHNTQEITDVEKQQKEMNEELKNLESERKECCDEKQNVG